MTPKEIILANVEHNNPDRPGLTFTGGRVEDILRGYLDPSRIYQQKRWVEGEKEFYDDEWGNLWYRMVAGSDRGEIFTPAITDWNQLDSLTMPDYDDPARYESMRKLFAPETDKFKLAWIPGWVFASSRYLRKMEVYFMDLIQYPDELNRLHSMVTDLFVKTIEHIGRMGADGIFFFEDLGTQDSLLISPDMWRGTFGRHYERLTGAAHEYGMKVFMHSCGYNWDLIDDLVGVGIDCFQFDQPATYDMPALAEKLRRHKVGLWSPVDIQKVLPTGDRDFIESEARKMVDLFRGGLIVRNYTDLPGIGVKSEWDMWAYNAVLEACGLRPG